jgi:hypothetical protein
MSTAALDVAANDPVVSEAERMEQQRMLASTSRTHDRAQLLAVDDVPAAALAQENAVLRQQNAALGRRWTRPRNSDQTGLGKMNRSARVSLPGRSTAVGRVGHTVAAMLASASLMAMPRA